MAVKTEKTASGDVRRKPVAISARGAELQLPPQHDRAIREIRDLGTLAPNWDSYGAASVQGGAQARAIAFMATLATHDGTSLPAPSVSASPDGGVLLRWNSAETDVMLTFLPDGGEYSVVDKQTDEVIAEGSIGRPEGLVRDVMPHLQAAA